MTENIQLTEGFFQHLFENKVKNDDQPILQILRTRFLTNSATICMKVQTSDGVFYFNNVGMTVELADRVKEDGLEELSGFPVIQILSFACQTSAEKKTMTILDYKILSRPDAKIGEPIQHTGDVATFTGIMGAKRRLTESASVYGGMPAPPSKRATVDPSSVGLYRISAINPFNTGKWKIQGVVSNKEEMREVQGKGGRGPFKVFNFEIVDKEGSAIRIASFGETAEKIFNQIQKDRTYYISGTSNAIRNANKRFNTTGHDYEISFNSDCVIEECEEQIAKAKFVLKPVPLAKISELNGQNIDVLAVIEKVEDCQTIMSRDQRELKRRNVHLIDQSGTLVGLTLWAEHAMAFDAAETEKRVIGIKGAFVREFNGTYSLSINSASRVEVDPEGPQTDTLMQWYENERPNMEVKTFSHQGSQGGNFLDELRSIHAVSKTDMPSRSLRGVYFDLVGIVNNVRMEGAVYAACPTDGCGKKVTEVDSAFRCEKCAQTFPECKYRYMVSMEVGDDTANVWLTLFDDQATKLFGKNATEMNTLMRDDRETYNAILQSKVFTRHQFRCRARMDTYNDITRPRIQVFDVRPLKLDQFSVALDTLIDKLEKLPA